MKQLPVKKPWEQWPNETDLAYSYLVSYMEMGPERSLLKVCQKHTKKESYLTQLKRWSSKYNWVERAKEYDQHIILKSLNNREKLIDIAHSRMLGLLEKALDTYEEILLLDDVIYVGEGSTTTLNERIKVAKDMLDRLGINFAVKEGVPSPDQQPTYQQINNYFYEQLNDEDEKTE